jgi:hypothetical protein
MRVLLLDPGNKNQKNKSEVLQYNSGLLDDGIITEEEFLEKKKELLARG